jgi:putative addiction module CopG family antidote
VSPKNLSIIWQSGLQPLRSRPSLLSDEKAVIAFGRKRCGLPKKDITVCGGNPLRKNILASGFAISCTSATIVYMAINFQISGPSEEFVQGQLESGRYSDAAQVVQSALRLMEEMDRAIAFRGDELREKIAAGYKSLQEGQHFDGDVFFAELDAEDSALLNASK